MKQVQAVLKRLDLLVLSISTFSIQGIETNPFIWGRDTKSQDTARAIVHIRDGLIKAGVRIDQKGGQHIYDTHNDTDILSFSDERVGKLKGGTDVIIAPYRVDESCLRSKLAVIIDLIPSISTLPTTSPSQFNASDADHRKLQMLLKLCSARCLSD